MIKKILLLSGLAVVLILLVGLVIRSKTKSHSPETNVTLESGDLVINVFYNRPHKKGRVIFGGLVPFGKTWRTGANEATVFETNKDILVAGRELKKGKYSLWTVPNEQSWTVVFNGTIPHWGIDVLNNGEAARDPENDVVVVDLPVVSIGKEIEQFTISLEKTDDMLEMVLAWDKTLVAVPILLNE